MMSLKNEGGSAKRPYSKPEMTRVKLMTEEAVFAGCKTDQSGGISGPGGSNRCQQWAWWGRWENCNQLLS